MMMRTFDSAHDTALILMEVSVKYVISHQSPPQFLDTHLSLEFVKR